MNVSSLPTKTVYEHLQEIRSRIFWSVLFIVLASSIGYVLHNPLLLLLIAPLNQPLYYTSPAGGFQIVLMTSLLFGLIVSAPILSYHLFRFLEPAMPLASRQFLPRFIVGSWVLMILGVCFAYYLSLPAALNFLNEFGSDNIQSLISSDTYFSFFFRYIGGFALLFQLPIMLLLIHHITPLHPKRLLRYVKYVIIGSFLLAALITPTPDPLNQTIMAVPIILLYLFSIFIIWLISRLKMASHTPSRIIA